MDIKKYKEENLEKTIFLKDEDCIYIMSGKSPKIVSEMKTEYVEIKGRKLIKGDLVLIKRARKPRWVGDGAYLWMNKYIGKIGTVNRVSSYYGAYTSLSKKPFPRSSIAYVEKVISGPEIKETDINKIELDKSKVEESNSKEEGKKKYEELIKNIKIIPKVKLKRGDWVLISGVPKSLEEEKYNGQIKQISKIDYMKRIFCFGIKNSTFYRSELKYIDPATIPDEIKKKSSKPTKPAKKKNKFTVGAVVKIKNGPYKNRLGAIWSVNFDNLYRKFYYIKGIGLYFSASELIIQRRPKKYKIGDAIKVIEGTYKGMVGTIDFYDSKFKNYYIPEIGRYLYPYQFELRGGAKPKKKTTKSAKPKKKTTKGARGMVASTFTY